MPCTAQPYPDFPPLLGGCCFLSVETNYVYLQGGGYSDTQPGVPSYGQVYADTLAVLERIPFNSRLNGSGPLANRFLRVGQTWQPATFSLVDDRKISAATLSENRGGGRGWSLLMWKRFVRPISPPPPGGFDQRALFHLTAQGTESFDEVLDRNVESFSCSIVNIPSAFVLMPPTLGNPYFFQPGLAQIRFTRLSIEAAELCTP